MTEYQMPYREAYWHWKPTAEQASTQVGTAGFQFVPRESGEEIYPVYGMLTGRVWGDFPQNYTWMIKQRALLGMG